MNEGEGRLLAVNRVFDDGSGRVDVARTEQDFKRFMPEQVRTRNRVIHISLNPHPDDRLTDTELEQLAREYLDRLGYGDQLTLSLSTRTSAATTCTSFPSMWTNGAGG